MKLWDEILEKLNPVQAELARDEGTSKGTTQTKLHTVKNAYELVEVVNRAVNLLVDNAALIEFDVGPTLNFTGTSTALRGPRLSQLLNNRPNPYMDISSFRRLILMDFIIDGNAFIHFDGTSFYHVPAKNMEVIPSDTGFIKEYLYDGTHPFKGSEIIFIKDNSIESVFRGDSRITSAIDSLLTRESMINFQKSFFDNGASIGLIVETEQILSKKLKDRQEREWVQKYNPKRGNGRPLILDAGLKAKSIASSDFREMAFTESITNLEDKVCYALGIPPILLNSGNNANIKPNLELMFYTTIIPMLRKFESALEMYFAYDIELSTHRVPALLPDLKEQADRISALVNNGIITGNEGRKMMRLEEIEDPLMKKIRIPANVAGSASGVAGQEGGSPKGEDK